MRRLVGFHLFILGCDLREAKVLVEVFASPQQAPRTGVNLMPFLKTLTCQRNQIEPKTARLIAHSATNTLG
ncbi:hypothetical protein RA27_16290 [Ruegeria sp. ANG-R]|nr:hypothetical protein RA27_16290 [Ruegeria sp. ANG-R]